MAHPADSAAEDREQEHPDHVGQTDRDRHDAAGVGVAAPTDQGAAAHDGRADGRDEHERRQLPTGDEIAA